MILSYFVSNDYISMTWTTLRIRATLCQPVIVPVNTSGVGQMKELESLKQVSEAFYQAMVKMDDAIARYEREIRDAKPVANVWGEGWNEDDIGEMEIAWLEHEGVARLMVVLVPEDGSEHADYPMAQAPLAVKLAAMRHLPAFIEQVRKDFEGRMAVITAL